MPVAMGGQEPHIGCPSSLVFNAFIHSDTVGGSKYSGNTTDGSSAGMFGNIEQRRSSGADGHPPGEGIGNDSDQAHKQEQMPAESTYSQCQTNEGTKRMSAVHLTPDYTLGASMSPQTSCSPSLSPSKSPQHSQIFPRIPEAEFIRRNTASWYERGKIIEIGRSNENTSIAGSSMVVVGRKHSSIVCLPLYKHSGIKGHERSFFKGRVSVYAKGKQPPSHSAACPCEPLQIALEDGRELSDDVWISVGEPHTIRHQEVEVALHGNMCEDGFKKLRGVYLNAQNSITDSDEKKRPNGLVLHVEIFWAYITRGGVWLGQKIKIGPRAEG
ncbi:hypothetical protein F5883DRAFT_539915 [Diaporthe sp. PMI_573]|nr:hypothetical protein F5883DRAFT_539915 [Diaporthaceae sp. PMI_573]